MAALMQARQRAFTAILLVVIVAFSANAWGVHLAQQRQDVIAARQTTALADIAANSARLEALVDTQCDARNDAAEGTNEVLDSLIAAVKITKSLPEDEKVNRLVRYNGAKVDLVRCEVTP